LARVFAANAGSLFALARHAVRFSRRPRRNGNPYLSAATSKRVQAVAGTLNGRRALMTRRQVKQQQQQAQARVDVETRRRRLYVSLVSSHAPPLSPCSSTSPRFRQCCYRRRRRRRRRRCSRSAARSRSLAPTAPASPTAPPACRANQRAGVAIALCAPGRRYIKAF